MIQSTLDSIAPIVASNLWWRKVEFKSKYINRIVSSCCTSSGRFFLSILLELWYQQGFQTSKLLSLPNPDKFWISFFSWWQDFFFLVTSYKILKSSFTASQGPRPLNSPTSMPTVHFLSLFFSHWEITTHNIWAVTLLTGLPTSNIFLSLILDIGSTTYFYSLWQIHPKFEAPNTKTNW